MKTILYVEDHPSAQFLMQAIIDELTGHRLRVAKDGAAAQHILSEETPDLYIIDLDLPDTEGQMLAHTLVSRHPAPVIFVSAYAEAADLGQHTYLPKPLDPDHVAEVIQRTLA